MKGRCRRFPYAPAHHESATRRQEKEEGNAIRTAGRRGSAPRSPGLYSAASTRVLAAKYADGLRTAGHDNAPAATLPEGGHHPAGKACKT